MDQLEQFRILRELFSLKDMKNQELSLIESELKRVEKVTSSKEQKLDLMTDANNQSILLKNQMGECERELEATLNLIETRKTQLNSLIDESQIKTMQEQIQKSEKNLEDIEEKQLHLLEGLENLEEELAKARKFLSGIDETINEFKENFNEIENKSNLKIEELKKRFLKTKELLSPNFQKLFSSLNKKDFATSPFTRLKGDNCEFCGMTFTKTQQGDVDVRYNVVTCSGCSRVLLPFNLYS